MGPEFDLDLLVAELATRGSQVFKSVLNIFLVELPCNSNLKLKISCSTRDECIFFIIQLVTIVHSQTNNNYYHVCYREHILGY